MRCASVQFLHSCPAVPIPPFQSRSLDTITMIDILHRMERLISGIAEAGFDCRYT